jgi:hypothetical protein
VGGVAVAPLLPFLSAAAAASCSLPIATRLPISETPPLLRLFLLLLALCCSRLHLHIIGTL